MAFAASRSHSILELAFRWLLTVPEIPSVIAPAPSPLSKWPANEPLPVRRKWSSERIGNSRKIDRIMAHPRVDGPARHAFFDSRPFIPIPIPRQVS